MSDSVQPHRRQPTRLPRPWDSPGKNTGMGCHFLLQCMKVKSESEVAQSCRTLSDPMDCSPPGSSVHGILQARVLEWGAIAFSEACALGNCKYNMHLGIPFSIHISSKLFYQVTCLSHHWILINSSLDKQFRTLHKQMYSWIFTLQFQVIK